MAAIRPASKPAEGFSPIAGSDARILILGSLPGQRSIAEQQYYAHPQNVFWRIMEELFGANGDYVDRCEQLVEARVALWDVLQSSLRPGSMDANIRLDSARANDFETFLNVHSDIQLIAFNGRKAEALFGRFVNFDARDDSIQRVRLPSTSPAYAAMSFSAKLALWRQAIGLAAE
ncbi:MAG: DNA-deoxyinosine glycosylase [Gammaproteobacteria bacterium]|nr:DNA-deoxyinosine glycosylase [Gammaproteobacteria bacterium]NNL45353.1 DNA-deoxyinosine glycosylase [Woeseiaceae bacterium]